MFPCEDSKIVSVCLSVCPHPEKRYHHSLVNISPTIVIDTSMERSSRVLHHGKPIFFFFFSKKFEFWLLTKSWNHLIFVNISPTLVIDTSMEWSSRVLHHGNPKIWFFFQKSSKLTKLNSVRTPSFRMPRKKSPWLRQYQSYIINWHVNERKGLHEYYNMGTKKFDFFFKKVRNSNFDFWLRAEITLASSISVLH